MDSVTPTAQAKPAAKKAIDDALKAKNDAIDANNDLTAEEKPKLRKMQKQRPMQLNKQLITRQQTQKWNKLKTAGTASGSFPVTPTPTAKPAAKQAIDDALKVKNDAIDANNDLTAEEKPKGRRESQNRCS